MHILQVTVLLFHVCGYQASRNVLQGYMAMVSELPELLDDEIEQVIHTALADKARLVAPLRNVRSVEPECINRLDERSCKYLASNGYCNLRRDSMEAYCKRACKMCVDPPCHLSKYGCCYDNKTLARGPNMFGCDDDCKDTLGRKFCKNLKSRGKCYHDHEKARRGCAVTCGYCRPCEDEDPTACQDAAKYGGCSLKRGEMMNICRKSCDGCGRKDPCFEFACPKGSVCKIDKNMRPFCKCHGNCHSGDRYTGILCGRDGVEYKNLCELKKINCGHPSIDRITVKNYGRCQSRGIAASDRRLLCSKPEPFMCGIWASKGYCKTRAVALKKLCPRSCNLCAAQASKPSCHYTKLGCCLDNKTACKGTDYQGCPRHPACNDFSKVFCKRFVPVCGSEKHKVKMAFYCPQSCRICH